VPRSVLREGEVELFQFRGGEKKTPTCDKSGLDALSSDGVLSGTAVIREKERRGQIAAVTGQERPEDECSDNTLKGGRGTGENNAEKTSDKPRRPLELARGK